MEKKFVLLLIFIVLNFFGVTQGIIERNNNITRERISLKHAKELIKKNGGVMNKSFSDVYLNDTYILEDGKTIVLFGKYGFLYYKFEDLQEWIASLQKKKEAHPVSHILKNRLLYGAELENHIEDLVHYVLTTFKLKNQTPSLQDLKSIDAEIKKRKSFFLTDKYIFSGLVAYSGEIIKNQFPGSKWTFVASQLDASVYEPYILISGKTYNPFFPVYKELFEELPETGSINLYEQLKLELEK